MKNLFSTVTFAAIFLAFAVTGVQANQVKKSKSNVSNNKVNQTAGEVCDDGNSNSDDCKKANKDYTTDPYVEGKSQIAIPSGLTSSAAAEKATEKADVGSIRAGIQNREASTPSVSEVVVTKHMDVATVECPPGTVPSGSAGCVPAIPASADHAINEKGLPGGSGSDPKKPKGEPKKMPLPQEGPQP